MKKFKGHFSGPSNPSHPSRPTRPVQPVPSNKTSAGFQKGGLPGNKLKVPVPLLTPIKCKVKTIGPLSGSAPQSTSGG